MDNIHVTFEVNGVEHPLSFDEPLNGAVNSEMEETLNWIDEKDINFDGIPDLMVYLGVTHNAQSLYKAFVWNPITRQFYDVKEFQEIQERSTAKRRPLPVVPAMQAFSTQTLSNGKTAN